MHCFLFFVFCSLFVALPAVRAPALKLWRKPYARAGFMFLVMLLNFMLKKELPIFLHFTPNS
jgi:hypothetical protein